MPVKQKILFLYSLPYGGHKRAADALRNALEDYFPDHADTEGLDAVTDLYPLIGPLVSKAYLEILRYTPQIWDFLYDNPDIAEITRELRQFFNSFNGSKLNALIRRHKPSAFVCTHAVPCGLIAEQKKRGKCRLPLVAVVTDYAVHSYWIYPEVDLYVVANEESRETLLRKKISSEKIKVCGIPIDERFNRDVHPSEARKRLGLEPEIQTVLIMAGAGGLAPMEEIVRELSSLKTPVQVIAVAGNNRDLFKKLSALKKTGAPQVHAHSDQVSLLMDAADLLITKPGGLTCSEALAKGLPMILINPIPGQEERNARYLLRCGAAQEAENPEALKVRVQDWLRHPEKRRVLSENCGRAARPFSARDGASEIMRAVSKIRRGAVHNLRGHPDEN